MFQVLERGSEKIKKILHRKYVDILSNWLIQLFLVDIYLYFVKNIFLFFSHASKKTEIMKHRNKNLLEDYTHGK
jgi:hypothetical protein